MACNRRREAAPAVAALLPLSEPASVRQDGAAVLIAVRAKPRAHAEGIGLESGGAWPVSVRAAPSDGEANAAVLELLARALGRPASTCSLHRGQRGRDKVVRVTDLDAETALGRLREFAAGRGERQPSRSAGRAERAKIIREGT